MTGQDIIVAMVLSLTKMYELGLTVTLSKGLRYPRCQMEQGKKSMKNRQQRLGQLLLVPPVF